MSKALTFSVILVVLLIIILGGAQAGNKSESNNNYYQTINVLTGDYGWVCSKRIYEYGIKDF